MSDIREDGSEILHYDNPDFPVFCRHNNIPAAFPIGNYSPNHWHEEVEIVYIEKGKIHHTVNDKYLTLHAGQGLFINSRNLHELISDKLEDCTLYCLIFNPRILSNCPKMEERTGRITDDERLEYILLDENTDWHKKIIEHTIATVVADNDDTRAGEAIGQLFCLWDQIYNNLDNKNSIINHINYDQRLVKSMIVFIQHNYKNEISLKDICQAANAGKTKCSTTFKKYVRMSPMDYLRCYRIEKSLFLLKNSDMSVSEIAYNVGFASASYYGESFKSRLGITPLQYRHQYHSPLG